MRREEKQERISKEAKEEGKWANSLIEGEKNIGTKFDELVAESVDVECDLIDQIAISHSSIIHHRTPEPRHGVHSLKRIKEGTEKR